MSPAALSCYVALISITVLQCGGERSAESEIEPEPVKADPIKDFIEGPMGKQFYDPEKSTFAKIFNKMEEADTQTQKSAKKWAQGTFEAMKQARRVLVQSTNTAQNVLLHDALNVNTAINGTFKEQMDKLKLENHMLPMKGETPHDLSNKWRGIPVHINEFFNTREGRASRPELTKYRGLDGEIESFNPKRGIWKVQPYQQEGHDALEPIDVHIGDFEIVEDEDPNSVPGRHRYQKDGMSEGVLRSERIQAMDRYKGDHQHVRIDSLPDGTVKGIKDLVEASQGKMGKVVNYSPVRKKFSIQLIDDNGNPNPDSFYWPWLEEGVHFHRIKDLEGLQVVKNGNWRGTVENWVPDAKGGHYNVKVTGALEPTVKLSPLEVEASRSHYWKKMDHDVDQDKLVGATVMARLMDGKTLRGQITAWDNNTLSGSNKFTMYTGGEGYEVDAAGNKNYGDSQSTKIATFAQDDIREMQVLQEKAKDEEEVGDENTVPEVW